jgi:transposase
MFIARVASKGKQGKVYTSILLRQTFRAGAKVKSKTLAVLTALPAHIISAIENALSPATDSLPSLASQSRERFLLRNAQSFGAVWTVDQVAARLGLKKALGVTQEAALGYWQVLARVLSPATSLLAMVRLAGNCAAAAVLGWQRAFTEDDLYANGSWLEGRQAVIERRLWQDRKDPAQNEIFLYDVTSSYLEGSHNALADWGYNRDRKKGKKQLVIGLLTDAQGDPVSIQVYPGNTSDVNTFADQVGKLQKDWGASGVTLVGDRGMIRSGQKEATGKAGFHFISSLTRAQIRTLLKAKVLQMELFEEQICEVAGKKERRYILRRNPVRQAELEQTREQKRRSLEQAIGKANAYLAEHPRAKVQTQQNRLLETMKKLVLQSWLVLHCEGKTFRLEKNEAALQEQSLLDGCYVIETDLPAEAAPAQMVHDRYKDLAEVERDFRTMKTGHMEIRPWFVCKEETTRAHALTAMLALKVRRHLEKAWEKLEVTVEEGLAELGTLCVLELVEAQSEVVVARELPAPSARQKELLDALGLRLPTLPPQAKVTVGTRKKIQNERKAAVK